MSVYAFLTKENTCKKGEVVLSGIAPDGKEVKFFLEVDLKKVNEGSLITKLTAKKLIRFNSLNYFLNKLLTPKNLILVIWRMEKVKCI